MPVAPSSLLSDQIRYQIRGLPRTRRSFRAWDELAPRHQMDILQWGGPPTPLARRCISGPWDDPGGRYAAVLIALYGSRSAAELAAGTRVIAAGNPVHRAIVELEAAALDVIDARGLPALTDHALVVKDPEAWQLLRAIRDEYGADAIWIQTASVPRSRLRRATAAGADMIVLFADCIDTTMHVREEAVYEINGAGEARLLRPIDVPQPQREPRTRGLVRHLLRWLTHITIALVAALVAHPIVELAGNVIGVKITVPAVIPALVGLGIGLAVARPITRRLRAYRSVMAHVLELPDTHALLMTRLDELQRHGNGNATTMRLGPIATTAGIAESRYEAGVSGLSVTHMLSSSGREKRLPAQVVSRGWTLLLAPMAIAVAATAVAHPILTLASGVIGVNISVPAVIPALVGLGFGLALARPIARRLQACRQVMAHVLTLPDSEALLVRRLDELQGRQDLPARD